VSSSQNPEFEPVVPLVQEPLLPPVPREPAWNGLDVLKIAALMFLAPFFLDILLAFAAHKLAHTGLSWQQLAQKPVVELLAEMLSYVGVIFYMIALVEGQYHRRFFEAISWNWPRKIWGLAALGGVLLFVLQGLAHFLPIPKDVPFEEFFKHPLEAYLTSILAISFGPLMEELFFRGFLYPVLARWLGVTAGVFVTALGFGMLHAMQLGFAWGAVFIIFLVGLALTIVRAVTNSVGCSLVVHIVYNSTLTVLTFIGTDGFRHLERLHS
jgi:membrane protease YdiL (CAAX protease family)